MKEWVKNCNEGGLLIVENFFLRKEELDQQSLNCVATKKSLMKMRDQDNLIEQLL